MATLRKPWAALAFLGNRQRRRLDLEAADHALFLADDLDVFVVLQIERTVSDDALPRLNARFQRNGFGRNERNLQRPSLRLVAIHDEDTGAIAIAFDDSRDGHVGELAYT